MILKKCRPKVHYLKYRSYKLLIYGKENYKKKKVS